MSLRARHAFSLYSGLGFMLPPQGRAGLPWCTGDQVVAVAHMQESSHAIAIRCNRGPEYSERLPFALESALGSALQTCRRSKP